jgi:hypothetical protein
MNDTNQDRDAFAQANIDEILQLWGPTIIHLVERQARNDFMFSMLEKQGFLPEGANELGDKLMDKLKGEQEAAALKIAAAACKVVPFEYVEKVGSVRKTLEKNDRVIANICKGLGIEPEGR